MKLVLWLFLLSSYSGTAQQLSGRVTDPFGKALAYATIEVKGANSSTTANSEGRFLLRLSPGTYTVSCQHIGYQRQERSVRVVTGANDTIHFAMTQQELTLSEVIVKKGEDPAYEIIRNTIKKRPALKGENAIFRTRVYTKGQMKLRDFPNKFMGQKIDFEDGDSSKKKMLFLSETVSEYAVAAGGKKRVEVVASKVSGQSDGFGLSAPENISFYENNIRIGNNFAPRGFVSPIADNALNFYRYKYEGAFFEGGRQFSRIRVTPKRSYEPLFTGYINILEDEWRIHSLKLLLTKSSGMELVDSLLVEQLYAPAANGTWVIRSQVIYPSIKMLGFDAFGSFINVYSDYEFNPSFEKGYFNNTVLKYTDSSNKQTADYWDMTRPLVLQPDEVLDYRKKDSLEQVRKSPAYMDSIDRKRNKVTLPGLLLTGISINRQKSKSSLSTPGLIQALSYNTVEGAVVNLNVSYSKRPDSGSKAKSFFISPEIRYGFSNRHLNGNLTSGFSWGNKFLSGITASGGTDVFQFSPAAPVGVFGSTLGTLFFGSNNMKIYEAAFGTLAYTKRVGNGVTLHAGIAYQDRRPLENTTDFTFSKKNRDTFTPNRPLPLFNRNIDRHQAFTGSVGLSWQPGTKYIELPGQMVSIGSKAPQFSIRYTVAPRNVAGSDVSYSKWLFNVRDGLNLGLLGSFNYYMDAGGFLKRDSVAIPDYFHYQGNMSPTLSGSFMDRFQLVPHYFFSNKSRLYSLVYAEHHFNGFITNKVPGLKQLKWNLVGGVNALFTREGTTYAEPFIGLENIFKVLRVDYIWPLGDAGPYTGGFRIGIKTPFNNLN